MKLLLSFPPEWLLITVIVLAFVIGCGIGWLIIKKKRSRL
jgi:hypothetical protein